jgi:hypothetical protein
MAEHIYRCVWSYGLEQGETAVAVKCDGMADRLANQLIEFN